MKTVTSESAGLVAGRDVWVRESFAVDMAKQLVAIEKKRNARAIAVLEERRRAAWRRMYFAAGRVGIWPEKFIRWTGDRGAMEDWQELRAALDALDALELADEDASSS